MAKGVRHPSVFLIKNKGIDTTKITVEYLTYRPFETSPNKALDRIEDKSTFKYYLAFHDVWGRCFTMQ